MGDFVGRQPELKTLGDGLSEARAGRPQVVVIDGPAGTGKTRLLEEFLQTAQADDVTLLRVTAEQDEQGHPLAVLDHLLRPSSARLSGPLATWFGSRPSTPDPFLLGSALVDALADLIDDDATLILGIDDAHWCDLASARALAFTLRRLVADRVLAVFAGRNDEQSRVPEPFVRLAERSGARMNLAGLDAAELSELAFGISGRRLSRPKAEALFVHTDGNPLYALAALTSDPVLSELTLGDPAGTPMAAPARYRASIRSRLNECTPASRQLLSALSAWGMKARLLEVAELAAVTDPVSAAQDAAQAHLLDIRGSGPATEVAFVHPLVRAAVYHGMNASDRLAVHARAAEVAREPMTRLNHRVLAAAGYDSALARELESLAAEASGRGAWATAAWALSASGRLTSERDDAERRLLMAAESAILAGDPASAASVLTDIDHFADTPRKFFVLGVVAMLRGQLAQAETALQAACDALGDPPADADLANKVSTWLVLLMTNAARVPEVADEARQVVEHALQGRGTVNLGVAVAGLWIAEQATDLVGFEGLVTDEAIDDVGQVLCRTGLRLGRAVARVWAEDLDGAARDLNHVLPTLREHGPFADLLVALLYLGDASYRRGEWDQAITYGELAVSAAEDGDQTFALALVHSAASWPLAGRGAWDAADTHVRAAEDAARVLGDRAAQISAAVAAARLAHAQGDPGGVLAALDPLYREPNPVGIRRPSLQPWQASYAEALIATGNLVTAERLIADMEEDAARPSAASGRSPAEAAWARGLLDEASGRSDDAAASLFRATRLAAAVGQPFLEARVRHSHGAFLLRDGQAAEARLPLQRALDLYRSLAAAPYAQRVERDLVQCEIGSAPTRGRNSRPRRAFTGQETAVATLVAQGLTNREVANELFLSVKTVEFHLSNIYTKLGVRSRSQLTKLMTERTIGPASPPQ